jgi:hypothetical protein
VFAGPVGGHVGCGVPARYLSSELYADVTGDGVPDRAFLTRSRCGWSVELVAGGRTFQLRIRVPYYMDAPVLRRAGNLDGRPGKELLVTTDRSGDTVTYGVVTFSSGLHLMSVSPARESVFTEGLGGGYGQGFGCVRPGLIEQISWGRSPPAVGERKLFAAHGLSWQLVKTTKLALRTGVMPPDVRQPFSRCR